MADQSAQRRAEQSARRDRPAPARLAGPGRALIYSFFQSRYADSQVGHFSGQFVQLCQNPVFRAHNPSLTGPIITTGH